MKLTILGIILIPIGLFLLLRDEKKLLFAAVLTCGLTGSTVLNVGDTGLQPSYFFALLWMIKRIIRGKVFGFRLNLANLFLVAFLFSATLSLIMPILYAGKIVVMNIDGQIVSLQFSVSNITQFIYLLFALSFFYFLSIYLQEKDGISTVYSAYLYSIVLVCIITFYQIIAYRTSLPFDPIFKTGLHWRFDSLIFWDKRLSGPCLESSMLAYYIVPALPLCVRDDRKWVRYGITMLLLLFGTMSFSSTFLVGAFLWIILEMPCVILKRRNRITCKTGFFLLLSLAVIFLLAILGKLNGIADKISILLIKAGEKFERKSNSGIERYDAFILLLRAFLKAPFLGVGFGSARGKDLFSSWLANTGMVGMGCVICFLFFSLRATKERGLRFACVLVWASMFISVAEPYNLFIWILMALAGCMKNDRSKDQDHTDDSAVFF